MPADARRPLGVAFTLADLARRRGKMAIRVEPRPDFRAKRRIFRTVVEIHRVPLSPILLPDYIFGGSEDLPDGCGFASLTVCSILPTRKPSTNRAPCLDDEG